MDEDLDALGHTHTRACADIWIVSGYTQPILFVILTGWQTGRQDDRTVFAFVVVSQVQSDA